MNHVFFHLELQSGPYCQSPDGNPMARMSIIGYSARSACRCSSISLLGDIMLINHLIMHISKYIRFGDTLERCCKGKAFIWIVQGFLQRKCYMGIISTHSSLGINPSIVPLSITQDVVCEVFAKYLEAMVSINPLRTSSFGKSRR